ncbi:MAG: DUF1461 domain-containing protein, partial [Clostridia bacterium]|nr:DUF1461 domain-containing protein [Clostridia bacterium]
AGCLGIWALVDFSGWFTAMHRFAFANELWLLDPASSLLIRMTPLSFFINAVRIVALRFVFTAVPLFAVFFGVHIITVRKARYHELETHSRD